MKATTHKQVQSRIGKKALDYTMRQLRQVAFESFGWNVEHWSKRSGVSMACIYKLLSGKTRFPRFETVVRLAHSVHIDFVPMESGSIELRTKDDPSIKTVIRGEKTKAPAYLVQ